MPTNPTKDLVQIHDLTFEPFIDADTIARTVTAMADQINRDYIDKEVVMIGVLKGAFVFLSDLVRQIQVPVETEFIRVSSYSGTSSTGEMTLSLDFPSSIMGKHIIIVEDIIDTGLTAAYLMNRAKSFDPASVAIATLFTKPDAITTGIQIDYVGMEIPDRFILGYGLDYDEKGRELANVYKLYKD